ncbi:hypothetical protein F5J12DRAFT_868655 [Pisolithus orientalis]|uniref:uncharacterized protein n=1 Tax=Pisolithus orientalis TaxID=936130 RepID=UPI002225609B|nr:uncharacterized protein F5J12DRAFT_868655 [Pisolithus orientalis]KAI5986278.1 hypothetical protein F5J12DRAFT_868655 [Pisolithus orientalis]
MDNPQQYQPLSHALNPPIVPAPYEDEEDEEEEGEEGEEEVAVENQLGREDEDGDGVAGPSNTPHRTLNATASSEHRDAPSSSNRLQSNGRSAPDDTDRKRRPGRPRGSKNRRPRGSATDASSTQPAGPRASSPAGASLGFHRYQTSAAPGEIHPHNQQYYEFQWRVLNLCAEFYGAAEELVKATPPLVVAQCYQVGSAVKVDPLTMLSEAKKICDALLASPAQLTRHPPPLPLTFIPSCTPATAPSIPSSNGKATPVTQSTTSVITNPQSFVVPMSHSQQSSQQFVPSVYNNPAYPTAPYYGYGGYGGYYPPVPQAGPSTGSSTPPASASAINSNSAGNQGAWSDEETEKLKKLAEEHRSNTGDIAWDALCEKWGNSRTRHQILIKATSLGLKESSSRGTKRRRDTDSHTIPDRQPPPPPTPSAPPSNTNQIVAPVPTPMSAPSLQQPTQPAHATVSPASSTPGPSTHPSPAIRHAPPQQQLQQTTSHQSPRQQPQPPPSTPRFTYPMPTVAAATSPVISPSAIQRPDGQSAANPYYRRPNPSAQPSGPKQPSQPHGHPGVAGAAQYIYQHNGRRES